MSMAEVREEADPVEWFLFGFLAGRLRRPTVAKSSDSSTGREGSGLGRGSSVSITRGDSGESPAWGKAELSDSALEPLPVVGMLAECGCRTETARQSLPDARDLRSGRSRVTCATSLLTTMREELG